MSNLLLTGATGFVGQHIISRLKSDKIDFVALQRDDVVSQGADAIIHLAGRAHVMHERAQEPLAAYMEANHDYALEVANQAVRCGVKRFVYVSSIKVNGEFTGDQPFNEADLANPKDDYAVSKHLAERSLQNLAQESGLEVIIVRPPLIYGAQVKANFLRLLNLVHRGWPLPLKSASNLRSMVYVENLVDALIACATHPAAAGEVFLMSDDETVSVAELVSRLSKMMGKPDHTFHFPPSLLRFAAKAVGKGDVVDRLTQPLQIDSSKIRKTLGWQAPYSLDHGLQKTVDWFLSTQK